MIYLGSDHRGFELKNILFQKLHEAGYEVVDLGNDHMDPADDYPEFAENVAVEVLKDKINRGILCCGSGVGVDIVANKHSGIRSALVLDVERSKQSREHEDVNVLSLSADILNEGMAWEIVQAFLTTPFSEEVRHIRRLEEIKRMEEKND